jgi:uncharacterized protein
MFMIRSVHIHKPERLDTGYNCIYIGEIGKMSDVQLEILDAEGFEWDENKSKANSLKHGYDFDDASQVLYEPVVLRRSDRNNDERWLAVGSLGDRLIAVIFTRREDVIRIISARRARKHEERAYRNAKVG